jgi:Flp pilus assembly pilin Flp
MIDRIVVWVLTLPYRVREESGQDLTEYALITGGVAIAIVAAVALFSAAFTDWFTDIATWVGTLAPI